MSALAGISRAQVFACPVHFGCPRNRAPIERHWPGNARQTVPGKMRQITQYREPRTSGASNGPGQQKP